MKVSWFLSAWLLMLLVGCQKEVQQTSNNAGETVQLNTAPSNLSRHEQGRAIYNFRCYFCHGYSGDAKTLAATYVNPKPRNFTQTSPDELSRERMLASITAGRSGTAMKGFGNTLTPAEIELVADFVRKEFMTDKAENTRYHTIENGWPDHERYKSAYPFALGEIPLDTPWEKLTPEQHIGKQFFLTSCITCHDRAKVIKKDPVWELRAMSYPRNQHQPGVYPSLPPMEGPPSLDGISSASPYLLHEIPPKIADLSEQEKRGETIFQANCAFCHAPDGTAKNWIGSFLEPSPRNLTDPKAMRGITRGKMKAVVQNGIPNSSMPAWKTVLSDSDIDAVIAYVSRAFHYIPESPFDTGKSKP